VITAHTVSVENIMYTVEHSFLHHLLMSKTLKYYYTIVFVCIPAIK